MEMRIRSIVLVTVVIGVSTWVSTLPFIIIINIIIVVVMYRIFLGGG